MFRVLTVGMDQRIVCYDVYSSATVFSLNLGEYYRTGGIESVVTSNCDDYVYCGCNNGSIYAINISAVSMGMLKAHSNVISLSGVGAAGAHDSFSNSNTKSVAYVLAGHNKPITSLVFSLGLQSSNQLLVSGSSDGSVCTWDMWSKQCLKKIYPFGNNSANSTGAASNKGSSSASSEDNSRPITNVLVCIPPEYIRPSSTSASGAALTQSTKPTLTPFQTLKKYVSSNTTNINAAVDALTNDNLSIPLRLMGVGLVHTLRAYEEVQHLEEENAGTICANMEEKAPKVIEENVEKSMKRKRKSIEPSGITIFE